MVFLGDMFELGADSQEEHQKIVDYLTGADLKEVLLVGKEFASTQNGFTTFEDAGKLKEYLGHNKPKGYTILIKGSNGIKLSTIAELL